MYRDYVRKLNEVPSTKLFILYMLGIRIINVRLDFYFYFYFYFIFHLFLILGLRVRVSMILQVTVTTVIQLCNTEKIVEDFGTNDII